MWVDISTYLEQRCWHRQPLVWHPLVSMWRSHLLMVLLKTTATAAKRTNHKLTNPPKLNKSLHSSTSSEKKEKKLPRKAHLDQSSNTIRMQCDNPIFPMKSFLSNFEFFYSNVKHLFYIELTHNGSDGVLFTTVRNLSDTRTCSHNALSHTRYTTRHKNLFLYTIQSWVSAVREMTLCIVHGTLKS